MNSEVPYQDTISIRSLIKSMGPCVYKQSLYALPLFPDVQDNIQKYSQLVLLSPSIYHYKGNVPKEYLTVSKRPRLKTMLLTSLWENRFKIPFWYSPQHWGQPARMDKDYWVHSLQAHASERTTKKMCKCILCPFLSQQVHRDRSAQERRCNWRRTVSINNLSTWPENGWGRELQDLPGDLYPCCYHGMLLNFNASAVLTQPTAPGISYMPQR